jgi:Protein of unknown function (DUF429)
VAVKIFGIDFTSAPRRSKAITVAQASLEKKQLTVAQVERLESLHAFDAFLSTPGAWIGGFDFPFGLPRELVETLAWPTDWRQLCEHIHCLGKDAFKSALDSVRIARPEGSKYMARRGDLLAGSSSPMKLVNPPVGLMFFEGVPRLVSAGVCVTPCAWNDDPRIALEAYPGFLARQITRESYKKDGREGRTPKRIAAREMIVATLTSFTEKHYDLAVTIDSLLAHDCVSDGSGDTLDAVLCAVQAAFAQCAFEAGDRRYGIPVEADDFEGWIATVN